MAASQGGHVALSQLADELWQLHMAICRMVHWLLRQQQVPKPAPAGAGSGGRGSSSGTAGGSGSGSGSTDPASGAALLVAAGFREALLWLAVHGSLLLAHSVIKAGDGPSLAGR